MMEVENKREESSGSVFADLNIPKPSLYLAKAQLAHQICEIVRERNLSQVETAEILGIDRPQVLALTKGNLDRFRGKTSQAVTRGFSFLKHLLCKGFKIGF